MKGHTFRYPVNDRYSKPHLHIIISSSIEIDEVLVVIMQSIKYDDSGNRYKSVDDSCLIRPHEHPAADLRESYIAYNRARVLTIDEIDSVVTDGRAIWLAPVSNELLCRIQDGARKSPHLARKFQTYFMYF